MRRGSSGECSNALGKTNASGEASLALAGVPNEGSRCGVPSVPIDRAGLTFTTELQANASYVQPPGSNAQFSSELQAAVLLAWRPLH